MSTELGKSLLHEFLYLLLSTRPGIISIKQRKQSEKAGQVTRGRSLLSVSYSREKSPVNETEIPSCSKVVVRIRPREESQ